MLEFKFSVQGTEDLNFRLNKLAASIGDWSAIWPHVVDRIQQIWEGQFASRGSRGPGGTWAPYRRTYAPDKQAGQTATLRGTERSRKERDYAQVKAIGGKGSRRLLKRLGAEIAFGEGDRLYRSLVEGSAETVEEFGPRMMSYGTRVPYALFHQLGTSKMAQRRIFDFKPDDYLIIARAMQVEAKNKATALGFKIASLTGQSDLTATEARSLGRQALSGEIPMPVSSMI